MRFDKIIGILFLIISGFCVQAQTILPGGYVSGTWDSVGSPYIIEDTLIIHKDSALYITEGVRVEFFDSAFMLVEGYISASGTISDSITFTTHQNSWRGIRIMDNDTVYIMDLIFDHCRFSKAMGTPGFLDGGALMIQGREVSIENCSFNNCVVENKGAAIYIENSTTNILNSSFESNVTGVGTGPGASKGGAIYITDSYGLMEGLDFKYNESVVAGALYCENSTFDIKDCIFRSNSSLAGGGAFVAHKSGVYAFYDCIFEKNFANGSGGAIAILEGVWARFQRCSIIENISQTELYLSDGGGVLITPYDNSTTFINCEISYNKAGDYGGGVYATSDSDFIGCLFNANTAALDTTGEGGGGAIVMSLSYNEVLNCTFSGNAGGTGTTVLCQDAGFSLINTIIWDDTIGPDHKIFLSSVEDPPALFVSNSNIEDGINAISGTGAYELVWGEGNIMTDPIFEAIGSDFAIANKSPCIGAGRQDTLQLLIPSLDLGGNTRIFQRHIDIGCYENQFPFAMEELALSEGLYIYPNPTRSEIQIEVRGSEFGIRNSVIVYDLYGRVQDELVISFQDEQIGVDVSDYSPGVYVVVLKNENTLLSRGKFVKN